MARTYQERNRLRNLKKTSVKSDFTKMQQWFPDRISIVSEGDSWFAYPPKWLLAGKPSNLVAHISKFTHSKANFYSMASNGDEAVDMVSGKQKHQLVEILRWYKKGQNRKPVDLLLFSGGGNDVVGENDFERFIKPYRNSYTTGEQCINLPRLKRKAKQIALAFEELIDIRDHYSPDTLIVTHTYDYPYPSLTGGEFLGGLIKTKAWMKRFMDEQGIKVNLQADVIRVFMDTLGDSLIQLESRRSGKFIVVDTRGTLRGKKEWLNEIHPTSEGFKQLASKMYEKMQEALPNLC